ncbi:MAG: hypothetical protein LAO20_13540 [Acidobacteriia bacterium]|nr:hypothetical protein [Terriglobia bacterium]
MVAKTKPATKKPSGKKPPAKSTDHAAVFTALRELLTPYEGKLAAKTPNPKYYCLESHEPRYKGRPMFFAAVRAGKNYVSYHLMPVYGCRDLLNGVSPELMKRMQGKACFNFTAVDERLFGELARLTKAGYEKFKSLKYL